MMSDEINGPFTDSRIIQLLSDPDTTDLRPTVQAITASATTSALTSAIASTFDPDVKEIICNILGNQSDQGATSVLMSMLTEPNPDIRAAAADAIAKIGSVEAGPLLLKLFQSEHDDEVRQMLAAALGAIRYELSIPSLIDALADPSEMVRGCAAWSLGNLNADAAENELRVALSRERSDYPANRMRFALSQITENKSPS